MTVASILNLKGREVATIAADAPLSEAVAQLAAKRIGALVVVDGNRRVEGIVSERDIVRALGNTGAGILSDAISSIMTRNVVTCTESDSINSLMERMTRGRFRHVPVIEDDRLAGLVSIGDVVKARIEEVEHEAEEMRTYISTV
ncbi:CBS domain-containing protein [Bauldia sp.]|uniref:CBS domain-containing protein n=1 Tax=Bauldia sp. TaxID=2575872 RepID=UPI003BAC07D9